MPPGCASSHRRANRHARQKVLYNCGEHAVEREHGSTGAFVSRWTIDRRTLKVEAGEDQAQTVFTWSPVAGEYLEGTTAWNRLCSADLPAPGSLFYRGLGTKEEIFLNGEEYDERFPVDDPSLQPRLTPRPMPAR